jgi:hypothetical protein
MVILTFAPSASTTASSPVVERPVDNEEPVGSLVQECREAHHRRVAQVQIVDETTEQFGHDHHVVLDDVQAGDVESCRGLVFRPHTKAALTGVLHSRSQLVAQI